MYNILIVKVDNILKYWNYAIYVFSCHGIKGDNLSIEINKGNSILPDLI
jgi:hypothetical protein